MKNETENTRTLTSEKDKSVIRELAKQCMEIATDKRQIDANRRMLATNDLKIVRPVVLMDEIPWHQMNIDDELTCICENSEARNVELELRKIIYRRKHFACDAIVEPFYRVSMAYDSTGIGVTVQEETRSVDSGNHIISHIYKDALYEDGSEEKLQIPQFTARPDIDNARMEYYTELFGDSMPVKLCGVGYKYDAPWDVIARLRGVETVFYELYDRPEHLQAIREKFYHILMAELDFIEKELHVDPSAPNLHCTPANISGLAQDGLKATWYRTMAQNFGEVSPDMHYEFDIKYAIEASKRFAYTYYGCCEPLDRKLDMIFKIENLRKVGVSPWAKEEVIAERLGQNYVYARKPNPANVALDTDYDVIFRETEKTVKLCQRYSCPVELVLKDISNVSYKMQNLVIWAQAVNDVLDKYYGKA